jgi:hypothetical protein
MTRRSIRPEFGYNGSAACPTIDQSTDERRRPSSVDSTELPSGESPAKRWRCLPFAEQLVRPLMGLIMVDYWTPRTRRRHYGKMGSVGGGDTVGQLISNYLLEGECHVA